MVEVRYIGIHDCVTLDLPLGGEVDVKRGDVLKTSDAHARSLCEQVNNWELVASAKAGSPTKPKNEPAAPDKEE